MRLIPAALPLALAASGCAEPPATFAPGAAADRLGAMAFHACARESGLALVAAHRGGPADGLPENALETLKDRHARAPMLLEVDLRQARDGTIVLMHDKTLDRTTSGSGRVDALSAAQIADLRLLDPDGDATDSAPPTLAETLAWADGRAILELDLKDVDPAAAWRAVAAAGAEDEVVLIAYTLDAAIAAARVAPDAVISAPIGSRADLDRARAEPALIDSLLAWTGTGAPDPALFDLLEGTDISIIYGALGPHDPARIREAVRLGADIVVSDHPLQAARVLYGRDLAPDRSDCLVPQSAHTPGLQTSTARYFPLRSPLMPRTRWTFSGSGAFFGRGRSPTDPGAVSSLVTRSVTTATSTGGAS